jgi:hypothetical protein
LEGYIAENYPGEKYQALIARKKQELSPQYRQFAFWKPEALNKFLKTSVRADPEKGLSLQAFDAFCKKRNLAGLTVLPQSTVGGLSLSNSELSTYARFNARLNR